MSTVKLSFDAIKNDGSKRRPTVSSPKHERRELKPAERLKAVGTLYDMNRNIALMGWGMRMHLAYVCGFELLVKDKNKDRAAAVETWWRKKADGTSLDIRDRFGLDTLLQLFESARMMSGDAGMIFTPDAKFQGIEGCQIGKFNGAPANIPPEGIVYDSYGRAVKYAVGVFNESGEGIKHSRLVPSYDKLGKLCFFYSGYFQRFCQDRGVSPLLSAYKNMLDQDEWMDWMAIKAKAEAYVAFVLKTVNPVKSDAQFGNIGLIKPPEMPETHFEQEETLELNDGDVIIPPPGNTESEFDLGKPGQIFMAKENETLEIKEAKSPAKDTQSFFKDVIKLALLPWDIPYAFFDPTGFDLKMYRQQEAMYEELSEFKRKEPRRLITWMFQRVYEYEFATRQLPKNFPPFEDLDFEFVPSYSAFVDTLEDVNISRGLVELGISNRAHEARKRKTTFRDAVDGQAQEEEIIRKSEVSGITIGQPGQRSVTTNPDGTPNAQGGIQ